LVTFESVELTEVVDLGDDFLIVLLFNVGGEGVNELSKRDMEFGGVPFSVWEVRIWRNKLWVDTNLTMGILTNVVQVERLNVPQTGLEDYGD
jgi:hypothetical protein